MSDTVAVDTVVALGTAVVLGTVDLVVLGIVVRYLPD